MLYYSSVMQMYRAAGLQAVRLGSSKFRLSSSCLMLDQRNSFSIDAFRVCDLKHLRFGKGQFTLLSADTIPKIEESF